MGEGLLEFLRTPAGQGLLAAGLGYAANAGRGGPVNAMGRGGLMGLQAYAGANENAKAAELRDMQISGYKAEVAAKNRANAREEAKQAALPALFRQPGMTGGAAVPQEVGGVPMFSQPMGVTPMQATPGGFDVMGAIRAGFTPDEIGKYAGLQDIGRPKATRQLEVDDGNGGKRIALVDDFGREVTGFAGYTAPVQVNQGDRVSFVKPAPGVSLGVNMSPSERDASARGWAGQRISEQRLALDQAQAGKPQFHDGAWFVPPSAQNPQGGVVRPNMPAGVDPKLTEVQGNATQFATRMLDSGRVLNDLESKVWPSTVARAGYRPEFPNWLPGGQVVAAGVEGLNRVTVPENAQRYQQAQENWVTANLRKESGAAIGKDEMAREVRKWFPQPGEDDGAIEQKRQARELAAQAMLAQAGPGKEIAMRLARQAAEAATSKNPKAKTGMGSGTALNETDPLGLRK